MDRKQRYFEPETVIVSNVPDVICSSDNGTDDIYKNVGGSAWSDSDSILLQYRRKKKWQRKVNLLLY